MTPVEILLEKLPGAKKSGSGWSAHCPAHEDRKASLSVSEGKDGLALVWCHAGCTIEAIVKEIGLTLKDLFPPNENTSLPHSNPKTKPKPSGKTFATAEDAVQELERQLGKRLVLWTYHDAQGEPVGMVVRWNKPSGKAIRPVARHGNGWRNSAMPDPRPLYALPVLAEAERVLVVEGEKAAEAARTLGFTATTSAGGSAAASQTDWQPLAGKEVWILPDNDPSGRKYAHTVAGILVKLGVIVKIIDLPGLPKKGDIVDWIDAHGDSAEPDAMRAEIEALAGTVEAEGTSGDVKRVPSAILA